MSQVFSCCLCFSLHSAVVTTCVLLFTLLFRLLMSLKVSPAKYIVKMWPYVKCKGTTWKPVLQVLRPFSWYLYCTYHITGTSPCTVSHNFKWTHVIWNYTVLIYLCCCSATVYLCTTKYLEQNQQHITRNMYGQKQFIPPFICLGIIFLSLLQCMILKEESTFINQLDPHILLPFSQINLY
jgi:hypothetical protein